jgi:hypothetical protein
MDKISTPVALIIERADEKYFSMNFYKDTILGSNIREGKKLIVISDKYHSEIIFTNEILSISCFIDRVDNSSETRLAGIKHQNFKQDKEYSVYSLGFYSDYYHFDLLDINTAIRGLNVDPYLQFPIKDFPNTLVFQSIYLMLEEMLDKSVEFMKIFKPNVDIMPTILPFSFRDEADIVQTREKIEPYIIEDYMGFSMIEH